MSNPTQNAKSSKRRNRGPVFPMNVGGIASLATLKTFESRYQKCHGQIGSIKVNSLDVAFAGDKAAVRGGDRVDVRDRAEHLAACIRSLQLHGFTVTAPDKIMGLNEDGSWSA